MPLLPRYIHIIKPKLKHIYLTFNEEGELVVKSPNVSLRQIEQLLLQKSSWIKRSREKFIAKKGKNIFSSHEDKLYFFGTPYKLELVASSTKHTKLEFDEEIFRLYYYRYDTMIFQRHIDAFYKKEALSCIPPLVDKWANVMNVVPGMIRFRKTKRQWGSCSVQNNLSFNTMMMKLPPDVINYIVVHELAHIRHKHHQKDFWDCVSTYLPEYKRQVEILKHFTT